MQGRNQYLRQKQKINIQKRRIFSKQAESLKGLRDAGRSAGRGVVSGVKSVEEALHQG